MPAKNRANLFQKGKSGNPGGRPKEANELKLMALAKAKEALQVLFDIMGDKNAEARSRLAAANSVLDRGLGKPVQAIDGDGEGGPIKIVKVLTFGAGDNSTE